MKLKKPITIQQQIKKLEEKNISIADKNDCKDFLSHINYYRFSAYFLPFLDRNTGKCFDCTTFDRLKQIYFFDQQLRGIIFKITEEIEIHLRTQIAYVHSHKHGADGYMYSKNFNPRHEHFIFLRHIESCIRENEKTLVVKHHKKHYNGKFPLWVIIEFFSIGMLSHFYRSMITKEKKQIAQELYGVTPDILDSWLRCLTDLRNRCAHHSRLYYWIFPALPKMPKNISYIPTRRLFAQLYMLKLMYPYPDKWNNYYLKEIIKLCKKYKPYISNKHLDFPYRWKSMLKK